MLPSPMKEGRRNIIPSVGKNVGMKMRENVLIHVGGWNKAVFLGSHLGIRVIYERFKVVVVDLRNGVVDELSCVWKRLTQRARPSTEILMWVVSKPPRFLALVMARHRCATRLSKVLYGLAPSFMVEALALSLARNSQVKWTL
nr:hypothetical protein Iba_chr07bCG5050 [Ipomoea batatas]